MWYTLAVLLLLLGYSCGQPEPVPQDSLYCSNDILATCNQTTLNEKIVYLQGLTSGKDTGYIRVSSPYQVPGTGYIMIIQMQKVGMVETDTDAYGIVQIRNRVGDYEFTRVNQVIEEEEGKGNVYQLHVVGTLQNEYDSGGDSKFQVIYFPVCDVLTLESGELNKPWNGETGGVLPIIAHQIVTAGTTNIILNGKGFRGGQTGVLTSGISGEENIPKYVSTCTAIKSDAQKGEGIGGTPSLNNGTFSFPGTYTNGGCSRGSPANAGGGADFENNPENESEDVLVGGGGGANQGKGETGGSLNDVGGIGGKAIVYLQEEYEPDNTIHPLFFGGGGGAGGDGSDGGNGGGIIFTRAHSIERTGGGFFTSFNVNGLSSSGNYGGAGGGGTIVFLVDDLINVRVNLNAKGGSRSVDASNESYFGGGGGGGLILKYDYSPPLLNSDVSAGASAVGAEGGLILEYFVNNITDVGFTSDPILNCLPFYSISPTPTPSTNPTSTPTATLSPAGTLSGTKTSNPTGTPTQTTPPASTTTTRTSAKTPTNTPTSTLTSTPTSSATSEPTPSKTTSNTAESTPTKTPSNTATRTSTRTPSKTRTATPTPSETPSNTITPTSSLTLGASPSNTPSNTQTPSITPSSTETRTPTTTVTPTRTATPTGTATSTGTLTPTGTITPSISQQLVVTLGPSTSPSSTSADVDSSTPSNSVSILQSQTPSTTMSNLAATPSLTPSITSSRQLSDSSSISVSLSNTLTSSITRGSMSRTSTLSPSIPPSASITPSRTNPPSLTKSISKSRNPTPISVVSVDGEVIIEVEVVSEDDNIVGVVTVVEAGNDVDNIIAQQGPTSIDPNVISEVLTVIAVNIFGEEISFDGKAEICISISERELKDESCLGFLDETKTPPEWICEDPCIELSTGGKEACGKTSHFTSFAILLEGNGNKDPCGSSGDEYIFNEGWQDAILIAISTLIIVITALLILLFLGFTRVGLRLSYGADGLRIRTLRNKSSSEVTDFR